VIQRI